MTATTTQPQLHPLLAEVQAVAFLIARARERAGHDAWDRAGIEPVLWHLVQSGTTLVAAHAAGAAAAADVEARTPRSIGWPKYRGGPAVNVEPAGPRCDVCGHPEVRCRERESKTPAELRHEFTTSRPTSRRPQ